jgi:hypothetical protein
MNDEAEILKQDRADFPHCMHSTSISKSCSMKDGGKMVCDTIRRIQRVCPDRSENKELINKKETSDEASGLLGGFGSLGSIFDAFGGGSSDGSRGGFPGHKDLPGGGELPGEIQQFMKAIESMDRMQRQQFPEKREDHDESIHHQSKGFDIDRGQHAPRAIPKNHAPNHNFPYNDQYDKILDEALGNNNNNKGDKKGSPKGPIERI